MKLLKISEGRGLFCLAGGEFADIDKITKEDLLRLVDLVFAEDAEFDEYDEEAVKNQAQQIVYKDVVEKLQELKTRRDEFVDESARLYLEEYERYQAELSNLKDSQERGVASREPR